MLHEQFLKRQIAEQNISGAGTPARASAKTAEQAQRPSEAINFKDLPPEGQAQMAAQAGIRLVPEGAESQ